VDKFLVKGRSHYALTLVSMRSVNGVIITMTSSDPDA